MKPKKDVEQLFRSAEAKLREKIRQQNQGIKNGCGDVARGLYQAPVSLWWGKVQAYAAVLGVQVSLTDYER